MTEPTRDVVERLVGEVYQGEPVANDYTFARALLLWAAEQCENNPCLNNDGCAQMLKRKAGELK